MSQAWTRAYIGLGSNLGEPLQQLQAALAALGDEPGIKVCRVSPFYRSAPWGGVAQSDFLNAVAHIETTLTPEGLLAALMRIEQMAGRERGVRWGPRTLDLDILLFGNVHLDTAQLQVPHPRMHERAFVLVPLADLDPALSLGVSGTVAQALARLGRDGVTPLRAQIQTGH